MRMKMKEVCTVANERIIGTDLTHFCDPEPNAGALAEESIIMGLIAFVSEK
jgi:hypothetical protein